MLKKKEENQESPSARGRPAVFAGQRGPVPRPGAVRAQGCHGPPRLVRPSGNSSVQAGATLGGATHKCGSFSLTFPAGKRRAHAPGSERGK